MFKKKEIISFLIFVLLNPLGGKLLASDLFVNGLYGEADLKGASIHQVPTYREPLPIICIQVKKWINANELHEKYADILAGAHILSTEQCQKIFQHIENEKKAQLTIENLTLAQQTDMHVGEGLRAKLGENYEKLMAITSSNETKKILPNGETEEKWNLDPQGRAQFFLKNLEQLFFNSVSSFIVEYKNALEEKIIMPSKGKEIKISWYNIWAEAHNEKIIPSIDPNENIQTDIGTWVEIMEYLVNSQNKYLEKIENRENEISFREDVQKNMSTKQALGGLLGALSIGEMKDNDLDILFENAINLCVEKAASPEEKAGFMFELYKIQINDSADKHLRQYVSYYLGQLEKYSPFSGDALKEYQQKVNSDQRIRLLKLYGESWNIYLKMAHEYTLTKETAMDAIFLKKAKLQPLAILMRKKPNILFQKVPGQSIQKWIDLIDYTNHTTIKAFAYLLLNLNINAEGYATPNDRYKGAAVEAFYRKIMEKAANPGRDRVIPSSTLDIFEMLGIGNAENLDIWEKIPDLTIGKYDLNVFGENVKVKAPKFKLNVNDKKDYIELYSRSPQKKRQIEDNVQQNAKRVHRLTKNDLENIFEKITGRRLSQEKKGPVSSYDMFFIRYKGLLNVTKDEAKKALEEHNSNNELEAYK